MPVLSDPRVRFWFTGRGWRAYGLRVAAGARASGRDFRVIRRKNPSKSMVVYRDDWQLALLPDRDEPVMNAPRAGRPTSPTSPTPLAARSGELSLVGDVVRALESVDDADP